MRFHILTFGCQMNVADSDWLSQALISRGWTESAEEDAQVFLVTTCSVREKPEQKVYSLLGRLKGYADRDPAVFVGVGGCVAQQIGEEFWNRFPFVRLVFGTDGTAMVPQALERLVEDPALRVSLLDFLDHYPEREQPEEGRVGAQAFVNIMQGCDNFCAYCIVPFTRGRQKSRSSDAIAAECESLVRRGARELTLLGQNVNSYGQDGHGDGTTFASLLRRISAIPGLARLKFTTSHPKDIAPEVVAAFGELPNLSPQLHLPVQSGSDAMLKSMGRKYTRERYLGIVRDLRAACPHIALTTDIIVGFPGETQRDFEDTLELMRQVRYESSFSFKYSDRPGVRAEKMNFKVPEEEKARRLAVLQDLQNRITAEELESRVGAEVDVLVEGTSRMQDGAALFWRGRDGGGRIINFPSPLPDLTGKMIRVRILAAKKHSLTGETRGEPW
ncbi:tRNA (N6-isopentenyl adenosine(37)-C2)-methylthiotransferase MiaB [Desulfomicrobium escambiense]|uniref:tRNA (N6-isopentenyl adenosine(37)-C2)-methylthiotransferase MiaB n=1 Tax=Desulfomicrobium escambiense TaxID=29503 RepID=UPI000423A292|nr:tRNA (N6-isopentenyl adenosine(37)-C2)-methylthiotransferase MiaB [Desulfomicrobium escambiense]